MQNGTNGFIVLIQNSYIFFFFYLGMKYDFSWDSQDEILFAEH